MTSRKQRATAANSGFESYMVKCLNSNAVFQSLRKRQKNIFEEDYEKE